MIIPNGLFTGFVSTQGFGSWAISTADYMAIEFTLKNATANFQISRYNTGTALVNQTGLKGEGGINMTFNLKQR